MLIEHAHALRSSVCHAADYLPLVWIGYGAGEPQGVVVAREVQATGRYSHA
jgi:hypothetical protein